MEDIFTKGEFRQPVNGVVMREKFCIAVLLSLAGGPVFTRDMKRITFKIDLQNVNSLETK